jgi:hypothetical protein
MLLLDMMRFMMTIIGVMLTMIRFIPFDYSLGASMM